MAVFDPNGEAVLISRYIRDLSGWDQSTTPPTPIFNPPLTTAEQATLADIVTMMNLGVTSNLTLAEFQTMKPDLANGRAYLGLSAPTNAQTVAVIKSVIRVLGALLRS